MSKKMTLDQLIRREGSKAAALRWINSAGVPVVKMTFLRWTMGHGINGAYRAELARVGLVLPPNPPSARWR